MTPAPLLRMPKIRKADKPYFDAFTTLDTARESGMSGPQPIKISELDAYFRVVGVDEREERVKYLDLIQRLDQVYLKHVGEQIAKNNKKPS